MGSNPDFVFFLPFSTFQLDQMFPTYEYVRLDWMDEQRASYIRQQQNNIQNVNEPP